MQQNVNYRKVFRPLTGNKCAIEFKKHLRLLNIPYTILNSQIITQAAGTWRPLVLTFKDESVKVRDINRPDMGYIFYAPTCEILIEKLKKFNLI